MAGHSQFKNIMHRKGIQDQKRGKIFTKIIREISVAIKEGSPDADSNPRLRSALLMAREANMPKDNIERAIKKATGGIDTANYEEVRYEGYGVSGVAIIVESLTDNRNRTGSEVRSYFTKNGGALGEPGSVSFMFDRVGMLSYKAELNFDTIFDTAINVGATDVVTEDNEHFIYSAVEDFGRIRSEVEKILGEPVSSGLIWKPKARITVNEFEKAKTLMNLIEILEDNDDVQKVFSNADISEDILEKL